MKPKTMKVIIWVLIVLMTIQFAAASLGKFTGAWHDKFIAWGFSISFMYFIGVLEIGSIFALFTSKIRNWGVVLLVLTMFGAIVTHLLNDEFSRLIHNAILIGILSVIFYLTRKLRP